MNAALERAGVSVIVPVYRQVAALPELIRRTRAALGPALLEILLVDDSPGLAELQAFAGEARIVELAERAGQSAAIVAGLREARGAQLAVLDADLQDPPEALPALLAALRDADLAFGTRRQGLGSRAFKAVLRALFPSLPAGAGLFFAASARAREELLQRAAGSGYLLAALGSLGLRTAAVPVVRAPRAAPSGYAGLRRPLHGARMLASALRIRAFGPQAGPGRARVARVYQDASATPPR